MIENKIEKIYEAAKQRETELGTKLSQTEKQSQYLLSQVNELKNAIVFNNGILSVCKSLEEETDDSVPPREESDRPA